MKQIFQDVQPGIVFETADGSLTDEPGMYLKLRDQKAVNLSTYSLARFSDQHISVEVIGTLTFKDARPKPAQESILALTPDWENQWTKEEAEKELEHFQFIGTGWYLSKCGEGLLVSDLQQFPVKPGQPEGTKYRFSYWTAFREAQMSFGWVANAPVRKDER